MNLPLPRLLHHGEPAAVNELMPLLLLKTDAIRSRENPEGMVYRVERKGTVDFLAKWVRPDFEAGKYCIGIADEEAVWNTIL